MGNKWRIITILISITICICITACEETPPVHEHEHEHEHSHELPEHSHSMETYLETVPNEEEQQNKIRQYAKDIIAEVIKAEEQIRKGEEVNEDAFNRFLNKILIARLRIFYIENNDFRRRIFAEATDIEDTEIHFNIGFSEEQAEIVGKHFKENESYIIKVKVIDFHTLLIDTPSVELISELIIK